MRVNLLRKAVLMKECVFAQSHCIGERIACSEKMVYMDWPTSKVLQTIDLN